MRSTIGAVAMSTAIVVASPALAGPARTEPPTVSVVHEAPVPCSFACPYWIGLDPRGFDECNPGPEVAGSFDVSTFRITAQTGLVYMHAWPDTDWDQFACTDTEPSRSIGCLGCNLCGGCYECRWHVDRVADPLSLGCESYDVLTWSQMNAADPAGDGRFRIVSYNWLDTAPLPVNLWGPVELVDDSYEARVI